MEVRAVSRNIRVSPYKVRLVVNEIKKMQPGDAVKMLNFTQQAASKPLKKVVMSAIANAKNNNNLNENSLTFKEIQIGHGLTFKRYRPISRGRVHDIKKITSHIRVVPFSFPFFASNFFVSSFFSSTFLLSASLPSRTTLICLVIFLIAWPLPLEIGRYLLNVRPWPI